MKNFTLAQKKRILLMQVFRHVDRRAWAIRKYGMTPTTAFLNFRWDAGQTSSVELLYPITRCWDSDKRETRFVGSQTLAFILRGFYTSMLHKMQAVC